MQTNQNCLPLVILGALHIATSAQAQAPDADAKTKKHPSPALARLLPDLYGLSWEQHPTRHDAKWPITIVFPGSKAQVRIDRTGEVKIMLGKSLQRRSAWHNMSKTQSLPVKNRNGDVLARVRNNQPTMSTHRATLGVQVVKLSAALASHLGLGADDGVMVQSVTKGGPADKAGLKKHDVIVGIGDTRGITTIGLSRVLGKRKPNERVRIRFLRGGAHSSAWAVLGQTTHFTPPNYQLRMSLPNQLSGYYVRNQHAGATGTNKNTPDIYDYILPQALWNTDTRSRLGHLYGQFDRTAKQLEKNSRTWRDLTERLKNTAVDRQNTERDMRRIRKLLEDLESKSQRMDRLLNQLERRGKIR